MPGGFKIASDSADNVSDGVVIEDGKGNQFVWIPVSNQSEYFTNKTYPSDPYGLSAENAYDDNSNGYLPVGVNDETTTVLKAGGFYIARFEAGKENEKVVSKKNILVWERSYSS